MHHKNIIFFSHLIFLHLFLPPYVVAQDSFKGNSGEPFTPSTILIIIIVIIFIFTGCLAVILRRFSDGFFGLNISPTNPALTAIHGLKPEAIESLPTYFYSDVKQHRKNQVELECAVCLNEFQDSEALRLLPGCSHVFHPRCIGRWLVTHVTCPICRQSLELELGVTKHHSVINIPVTHHDDGDQLDGSNHGDEDCDDNQVVEDHDSDDVKKKIEGKFPRSHSAGHSMGDSERFTLVLPEEVQNNLSNRSKTLRSILSPTSAQRLRSGPVHSVSTGLVVNSSKNLELPRVKTSDLLWPI